MVAKCCSQLSRVDISPQRYSDCVSNGNLVLSDSSGQRASPEQKPRRGFAWVYLAQLAPFQVNPRQSVFVSQSALVNPRARGLQ
jgi:hypothetical protein